MFPETVKIQIPPQVPSPMRLALEVAEVGGCGSWESVLMFATELSTDDENLHYVAGLRDPQLVQLYDASVASFAEIAKISSALKSDDLTQTSDHRNHRVANRSPGLQSRV